MTIHWCGTGLSAIPGLRRLIEAGHDVVVWNRTVEKAIGAVGHLTTDIQAFDPDALAQALRPDDVVVSMLPGDWHVPLAQLCIENGAHFVSSSYISPEMKALTARAERAGVALVGEVGLDPGIDHLFAHWLVADYRRHPGFDEKNTVSFTSYCGGIPKETNAFRYKFSWSPARRAAGAEKPLALDPRVFGARCDTPLARDHQLLRPPADTGNLRGLPQSRFPALHRGLRVR